MRELCPDVLEQRTADVRWAYSNWRQGLAESRRAKLCKYLGSKESGGFPRYEDFCRPPSCRSHPCDLAKKKRQEFFGELKRREVTEWEMSPLGH